MTTADLQQLIREREFAFDHWFSGEVGPHWCIAPRATPRLLARYGHVITPGQARKMRERWEAANPVTLGA
jgi:hypothetical protein